MILLPKVVFSVDSRQCLIALMNSFRVLNLVPGYQKNTFDSITFCLIQVKQVRVVGVKFHARFAKNNLCFVARYILMSDSSFGLNVNEWR